MNKQQMVIHTFKNANTFVPGTNKYKMFIQVCLQ